VAEKKLACSVATGDEDVLSMSSGGDETLSQEDNFVRKAKSFKLAFLKATEFSRMCNQW